MGTVKRKRRPGAGRPKNNPPTKARCIRITDAQSRLLRMWGKGDMSAGLRWLIDAAIPMIRRRDELVPPHNS